MRVAPVVVLLLAAVSAWPAGAGDIMVTCWPGHRIYLDDDFVGMTTVEQDGLYLQGVEAGSHTIRVEKNGFVDAEYAVEIPEGRATELKVERPVPATGEIRIECPAGHRIYLDGDFAGLTNASGEDVVLSGLTVGAHTVRVEKLGLESLEGVVEVPAGGEVDFKVDSLPPEDDSGTGTIEFEETSDASAVDSPESSAGMASAAAGAAAAAAAADAPGETAEERYRAATERQAEAHFQREQEPEPDVMFAYLVHGGGMTPGSAVNIHREVGGPRAPVLAFVCSDGPECSGQTRPSFPPGRYRFRVNCRRADERGRSTVFSEDRFLELEAASGNSYLIEVDYAGGQSERCTADIRELQL